MSGSWAAGVEGSGRAGAGARAPVCLLLAKLIYYQMEGAMSIMEYPGQAHCIGSLPKSGRQAWL